MEPNSKKHAYIIGVPLDHGAGRRGVGMGPSALRLAGLQSAVERLGHQVTDMGDIMIESPETLPIGESNARFLPLIARVCTELCEAVQKVLSSGGFPLVIGGDHSIAIGTISGVATTLQQRGAIEGDCPRLGVLWFDAHGDINTPESSPSGNIHGMPVSALLGNGPLELTSIGFAGRKMVPAKVAQIGLRDIDKIERKLLKESGIHTFTMADIDRRGMATVMEEALSFVLDDVDYLHVSFDIDGVDPRVAPGTGTPKLGGLTYREAHLAMEMVAETGRLTSLEMVEVNPALDDKNTTSEVAVGLIASALGKSIL